MKTLAEDMTCSNGFRGIESKGACCVLECGQCGGVGCSMIAGLSSAECCEGTILENAATCEEAGEAPCVIDGTHTTELCDVTSH